MKGNIDKRWRLLSGEDNWKTLLDPLDIDLRRYLIHYGEMAQATYDTFNEERVSKYAGDSRYAKENLFSKVGLVRGNPFEYEATKYFYATSAIAVPESFILKPLSEMSLHKKSNWIGYVAVATDEGKTALGRRDIVIAWRGTLTIGEWIKDLTSPLVSAPEIFGKSDAKVHKGWLSLYTSSNPQSTYSATSARDQILAEVKRLMEEYKDEEISITVTGHSLGASLAALNAADIVASGYNKRMDNSGKNCPVTAFCFASPRVGDIHFRELLHRYVDLHILRVVNVPDVVTHSPPLASGYIDVGEELKINTQLSKYLKHPGDEVNWHVLEAYLHGVAGTQGIKEGFHLEVKRDIALINKMVDALNEEYLVPVRWWCMENKGMVQEDDGSWKMEDHEENDDGL